MAKERDQAKDRPQYQGRIHQMQKDLMARWMGELEQAARNSEPTACLLVAGSNLAMLLRCLGIHQVYPELNALQLAIRKQSLPYIQIAEERGYSTDVCSYVKADIGAFFAGNMSSLGTELPKPSIVLSCFSGCNVYIKWFEHIAAYTGAPLYVIDIPFIRSGEDPCPDDIDYVVKQLKEVIELCQKISGKNLDYDQLRESLALAREMERLWSQIKELTKNIPSPYDDYFDCITLMGPFVAFRGTQEGVDFLRTALQEFEERVRLGIGPIPQEKFRIVVESAPPYPFFRTFRDLFTKWGACAVGSTYTTPQPGDFLHDPDRPLESLAEYPIRIFTNRGLLQRYELLQRYIKERSADALIIHSVKSCRLFSVGHGDMRNYFSTNLAIPTLMLESDLEDPRYFFEAQMKNRVDAFFEVLEHKKYLAVRDQQSAKLESSPESRASGPKSA
ncbi:MAG: 2-hydroxyacyl-CoA dehydratase [Deltaproteobacteria bacterium]|nr:2-hydroxyacyl-CoA dehydratase [Deltaproteobacteria bacterium]